MRIKQFLLETSRVSRKLGIGAYLVGGAVRDMLSGRKTLDIDIMTECSPAELVGELARIYSARVISYPKFGTFILKCGGWHADFATARRESYLRHGALPKVSFSTVREDLKRRDFTINALAAKLLPSGRFEIIDLFGGKADIKNRILKVLHEKSFKDDPTRILRLARFVSRGYRTEKRTLVLAARDSKYLRKVSNERIREEIIAILSEKKPAAAIKLLNTLGLTELIFGFKISGKIPAVLDKKKDLAERMHVILKGMPPQERKELLIRYGFTKELKSKLSRIADQADDKHPLTGADLIKLGYSPGPLFGKIFSAINNNRITSRKAAVRFLFDNFPEKS